jgi:hypothetical protein
VIVLAPALLLAGLVAAAPAASAQQPGANGEITSVDQAVWSGTTRPNGTFRACCDPFPDEANPDKPIVATEQAVWGPDGRTVAVVGTWVRDGGPGADELLVFDIVADTLRSIGAADDSRPDFSPDGSQVVIARGGDLVVLDLATGAVVRALTDTPGVVETDPSWSPDGTTIAYATAAGVSTLPAAGGTGTLRLPGASAPQFSGDGEHLAYLAGGELVVAAADGTGGVSTGLPTYAFAWAPDSTLLAGHVESALLPDAWAGSDTWVFTPEGAPVRAIPGGSSSSSFSWQPVPAPEPAVVTPSSSVSGAASSYAGSSAVLVRWTASDLVSPVVSTDVRYRRADALGGGATSFRPWITASTARRATLDAVPGHRYCFSSRARNEAGAVSGWSPEKCSVVPFDDRQLSATGAWARVSRDGFLRGTATRTSQKYAALTSAPGFVREVGVIASTGPNGGRVAVLVGGRRVGTISLVSATNRDRAFVMLPRLAERRYGPIRLVVLTSGRTVRIDGLAASAW